MNKKLEFPVALTVAFVFAGVSLQAQGVPPQQRVLQPIIINGQSTQGVTVIQNGAVQGWTCPNPQQYVAADQSSSGWACFDQASSAWLLHALPPQQTAPAYPPPTVVYQQPTVYVAGWPYAYSYGYPYYYPYAYPYYGPAFGVGFGFGYGWRGPLVVGGFGGPWRGTGFYGGAVGRVGFGRVGRR